jgi:hypothetical protein
MDTLGTDILMGTTERTASFRVLQLNETFLYHPGRRPSQSAPIELGLLTGALRRPPQKSPSLAGDRAATTRPIKQEVRELLEIVHQIQIGKSAPVFVDIVVAIRCNEDGTDIGDTGNIRGHELLPDLLATCGQVQFVDGSGHFA